MCIKSACATLISLLDCDEGIDEAEYNEVRGLIAQSFPVEPPPEVLYILRHVDATDGRFYLNLEKL